MNKSVFKMSTLVSVITMLLSPQSALAQSEERTLSFDYDGDLFDDIVFRRSSTFETIIKRSSDGENQLVTFGRRIGDVPVRGDFDGDGITDVGVRRASGQIWYIQNSSGTDKISGNDDGITRMRFGLQTEDIPVPADYDGDGITDLAVRRPSNQTWYILNSSGEDLITGNEDGITRRQFGLREDDIPVPADYDGDGKADIAVRRASNQVWYILNSSGVDSITDNTDGITRSRFGTQEADIPVPADYDGDGKVDLAVRRPGTQFWYIQNSSGIDSITSNDDGITRRRFGLQENDIPTPADYDGDGKVDLAVRRASNGIWFVLNSSGTDTITGNEDGITRLSFGSQSSDLPLAQTMFSIWNSSDIDEDGLSKDEEAELGTDFTVVDTDGDGLSDGDEVNTYSTSPTEADTDNDGLNDSDEVNVYSTDPTESDTDGDGLSDASEINTHSTDPNVSDTDGDGLADGIEVNVYNTNPTESDTDSDGLSDADEINTHQTDPTVTDSDNDGLSDGDEVNTHNTDPNNSDSDNDGINDGDEVEGGSDPNEAEPALEFSESNLITSVVDNIYVPTFELFAEKAQDLNTAVTDYCAALPDDANNLQGEAQDQWKNAMDTWQMAELMQVGPLFENDNERRDRVYSWPNKRECFVDQDVVSAESVGYDITSRNVARKGLDALEYLLFDTDLDHKCTVPGTEPDGWNDRTEEDRIAARCNFASVVSADILAGANDILDQWSGTNGYADIIKEAGNPGSEFETTLDAINDISDGLFYFVGPLKDGKIAAPVGLKVNNCGLTACPEDAESVYSDYSLENIINNMKALRTLLAGDSDRDISFVDFLNDVGDSDTATNIIAQLDEAIALAEGLSGTYSEVLTNNPETIEQLHEEVNDVDDIMKSDFIQSLSLELPSTSAGDND